MGILIPKMLNASIEREPVVLKTEAVAVGAARIGKDMRKRRVVSLVAKNTEDLAESFRKRVP